MRFTPQFLERFAPGFRFPKSWASAVRLKKAGKEYKGLSPFQQEKTPSFTVNDQKGFYHDFSSGKHGNIFDFVMETEGVSFPEAVERLASMAGMALPAANPDAARHEQRRKTLHDVMELAAKFFQDNVGLAGWRQGARLSRRSRACAGHAAGVSSGICARRTLCAEGASRRPKHSRRRHGGGGAARRGRRHPRAL